MKKRRGEKAALRVARIQIWWDTTDPHAIGWAYRAWRGNGEEYETGPVTGRRMSSDATLTAHARAAVGVGRRRVPVEIIRDTLLG